MVTARPPPVLFVVIVVIVGIDPHFAVYTAHTKIDLKLDLLWLFCGYCGQLVAAGAHFGTLNPTN